MQPEPSGPAELVSTPVPDSLPGTGAAGWAVVLGTGAATFVAQWVSVQLWVQPTRLSTLWLAGGFLLGVALLTQPRRWAPILAAGAAGQGLLVVLLGLASPLATLVFGLITAFTTTLVATVLRRVLRTPITFGTLAEYITYLIVVVLGGALVASTLFIAAAQGYGIRPPTFLTWRTFGLAAVLGYTAVTPTLVLLVQEGGRLRRAPSRRLVEGAILGLLLILACIFVANRPGNLVNWTAFAITVPPLLLWSTTRFGPLGASSSLLLVTLVSTLSTGRGHGPFSSQSPGDNTLSLQLFMLATGLPFLGLAVVLGEHRRTMSALETTFRRNQGLNRDLLTAREQEGNRIAHELHDDVGQRLALISIGLSRLRRAASEALPDSVGDITRLQEETGSVVRSLRDLSHQLHPAALEHAGLSAALEMQCEEVRRNTGLDVRVASEGDFSSLSPDIALALFRVTQEALNNVIRHAGARTVEVVLRRLGHEVRLRIADDGRGFKPSGPGRQNGLGIHSMTQRVAAVGGTLNVESAPGSGATLLVIVPLGQASRA